MAAHPVITIISPAYNEEENLELLYDRIKMVMENLSITWEWIIIDDHSSDATFSHIKTLAANDSNVKGIRFARNSGSHTAIMYGLNLASGECAVVLAADLQDPPEVIEQLFEKWKSGAQIVWAVRKKREGESNMTVGFAKIYYWLMNKYVGIKNLPDQGADFFLLHRNAIDTVVKFKESNISLLILLTWLGFRQDSIEYVKQARLHGSSGWSVEKKLKLVIDSIVSFTYKPIRFMTYFGFSTAFIGFAYALFILINHFLGEPITGWSSLMIAVLVIGGIQILMMGILGEYIWRSLDEVRSRPQFIIEQMIGVEPRSALTSDEDAEMDT